MDTKRKTVLIIEDDAHTAALVSLYLKREGFHVIIASDGEKGLSLAHHHHPELVILDLMLPNLDGWEICRRLRRASDVPVIMLTARDEEIDRVAGLTLGADDYVVKPFSPRELTARVLAVLRRAGLHQVSQNHVYQYDNLTLDVKKRSVYRHGQALDLTHHEYILLEALMKAPGKVFTRDELIDFIYPQGEAVVVDRVIDVHIGKLRKKIESDPSNPQYILTVRGIGYRFEEKKISRPKISQ
jgi:DNA-binding response OmpR family regulator